MDSDLLRVEDLLHTAVSETIGSPSPAPSPITITAVQEGSPVVVSGNEQGSESSPGSPQYVTDLFSIQTLDSNSGSPLPITTEDMAAIGMTSEDIIPAPEDSMQLCRYVYFILECITTSCFRLSLNLLLDQFLSSLTPPLITCEIH